MVEEAQQLAVQAPPWALLSAWHVFSLGQVVNRVLSDEGTILEAEKREEKLCGLTQQLPLPGQKSASRCPRRPRAAQFCQGKARRTSFVLRSALGCHAVTLSRNKPGVALEYRDPLGFQIKQLGTTQPLMIH